MIRTMIFSLFMMWCIHQKRASKANTIIHKHLVNDNRSISLSSETDLSNYKIKIIRTEISYSLINFTIVDERNKPLRGMISLKNVNNKGITGLITNEDGKITVMVFDDSIRNISVGQIGSGIVNIPIEKIKNKITEIKVQLYPFTTTN